MRTAALIAALFVLVAPAARAQEPWTPPTFVSGSVPAAPVHAVGGGQVLLEVNVTGNGSVRDVTVLRATPPFTDPAVEAVHGWRFRTTQAAPVLVAYVAPPPAFMGPTLGQPPADAVPPSDGVAYPTLIVTPNYPPRGSGDATALVDITVDDAGRITDITVEQSAGGFDDAAVQAARQWRFRPARVDGVPVTTHVYVVFAWRAPVVTPARPR